MKLHDWPKATTNQKFAVTHGELRALLDEACERIEDLEAVAKAAREFKASFDRGFPNSLNAIQAIDAIFDALDALQKGSE